MIDWAANEFERADAEREARNQRQHQIALLRWQYPWGSLPEAPIDLPDHLAASEHAGQGDDE